MRLVDYNQLGQTILWQRAKLPDKIDLVAGIPRSGMIPAAILAGQLNLPLTDTHSLLKGEIFPVGRTKKRPDIDAADSSDRTVLVIDDCVGSGRAFKEIRQLFDEHHVKGTIVYCAVYCSRTNHPDVDVILESIPSGYVFPWNLMHHRILSETCVDIDGVLCHNPPGHARSGTPAYLDFLESTAELHRTSGRIGYLVTSRLEMYREQTEAWLKRHEVEYGQLVMATERDKEDAPAYKARVFQQSDAKLFIESEYEDAVRIADESGKPVISIENMVLLERGRDLEAKTVPITSSLILAQKSSGLKLWLRRMMGDRMYGTIKRIVVSST